MSRLTDVDLDRRLRKSEAKDQLSAAQQRLVHLRLLLGGQIGPGTIGPPLLVLFEGWDASGKGGAIKRLVGDLDPRHVRVAQFAAPTHDEKRHHFLWRFWPVLPGWGGLGVLGRPWDGRGGVGSVEGVAPAPGRRHGRAGPHLVRTGARGTRRGVRPRAGLAAGVPGDRGPGDDARRRGHDHRQVLDAPVAGGAAAPLRVAPGRPVPVLEADRGGLAQPGAARCLRTGGRGDAGEDRPCRGSLARRRRGGQALGPGRRGPHGLRADRAGTRGTGHRPRPTADRGLTRAGGSVQAAVSSAGSAGTGSSRASSGSRSRGARSRAASASGRSAAPSRRPTASTTRGTTAAGRASSVAARSRSNPPSWCSARPSCWACTVRCATAWPVSYTAHGLGAPSGPAVSAATTTSADAARAHSWLPGASEACTAVNSAVPRRATANRHGWLLLALGAHRAASSSAVSWASLSWCATSRARGLQRSASRGCNGTAVTAVLLTVMTLTALVERSTISWHPSRERPVIVRC